METKTDRTAGTAATGSGGPDWGRWAPPQCAAQKSLAGRSPTASRAGQEALLTGVLGCRLRGSEPGEGFRGASIFRRRQRHGRPAAGKRSRRGALSRLPSLTAWLAPRLTFSAANSTGHGPPLPRRPPHHDYSFAICAPLASPAAHTLSQPWTPPPQPPNCKPGREGAPRSPPAPPPPPSSLPLCLSCLFVCLSLFLALSAFLCSPSWVGKGNEDRKQTLALGGGSWIPSLPPSSLLPSLLLPSALSAASGAERSLAGGSLCLPARLSVCLVCLARSLPPSLALALPACLPLSVSAAAAAASASSPYLRCSPSGTPGGSGRKARRDL